MKIKTVILTIFIIIPINLYSQKNTDNLWDLINSKVKNNNYSSVELVKNNGNLHELPYKFNLDKKIKTQINEIDALLIERGISYQNNTLYILLDFWIVSPYSPTILIKSNEIDLGFSILRSDPPVINTFETCEFPEFDIWNAVTEWDEDYIKHQINIFGSDLLDGGWYIATKIIIEDGLIIEKDVLKFDNMIRDMFP